MDLRLFLSPNGGRIGFAVHQKAISQHVPLAIDSSHPRHVRRSRPRAQLVRFRSLTSSKSLYREAVQRFRRWLQSPVPEHPALTDLPATRPACRRPQAPVWMILPHHPVWEAAPRECGALPFLQLAPDEVVSVRPSWKLTQPHYEHFLRRQFDPSTVYNGRRMGDVVAAACLLISNNSRWSNKMVP